MTGTSGSNPLAIPPALLAEIQAEADKEHRPAAEVLQDAVQRYVREKRWQRTLAYGAERAKALGLTEEDVPRLIAEYRQTLREGRVSDGEAFMAKMNTELAEIAAKDSA